MKDVYKVWRSGRHHIVYFARAATSKDAIEKVTMRLADLGGITEWKGEPSQPAFQINDDQVYGSDGQPIKAVDY